MSLRGKFDEGQAEPESRALARFTGHLDLSPQRFHELPGNGQSQAGTTIFTCGGAVSLDKSLKDLSQRLWRQAGATITDGIQDLDQLSFLLLGGYLQPHFPLVGEFNGIAQEVEERVGEEEMEIGGEVEEIEEEKEEIEAISFDELSQLDSGPIKRAEAERLDTDEAMDRAAKVEQEITAQKELEREEEVEEVEEAVKPRPIVKKRRRSRLWITILLVILIIAVGGAALVVFKPDFLPESFPLFKRPLSKDQAFDMGNKRLSFKDLNGSFVNSKKAGKLFVVKGLVTNMYPDKRSFIRIRSNILDSKGKAVKSKIVYAGNPISDKQLLSLSMEEVDNRLRDKSGKNKMNTNIPPNSSIPLMIVFGNLPQDLSEFEVEAISSSPAGN